MAKRSLLSENLRIYVYLNRYLYKVNFKFGEELLD